jgi:hypothetical protein
MTNEELKEMFDVKIKVLSRVSGWDYEDSAEYLIDVIRTYENGLNQKTAYKSKQIEDNRHDIADSYYKIYENSSLSSHFPEPEIDRYP